MIPLLLCQIAMAQAPPPERFELANGLRVWVQEEHSRPVALVQVTYKAGSHNEGPGTTGIAHYVEHMMYRATANIRNEDIYGYIDRIGGRYTGGTYPDRTQYGELVPRWALESALRVTAERMSRALFDSVEFERERGNILTEVNGYAPYDPRTLLDESVMLAAFNVHPYRYGSGTWARDNLVLTRAEAYAWYKRYYGPNNAVLVVVGDVSATRVKQLVEQHFALLPRAPSDGRITLREPPPPGEKRVRITHPDATRRLEIVYRAPAAADPDYPAFAALTSLIGIRLGGVARPPAPSERIATDSARSPPGFARIGFEPAMQASMDAILAMLDSTIEAVRGGQFSKDDIVRALEARARRPSAERPNPNVPPRRSSLTVIADALLAREALPWEVSRELHERVEAAVKAITREQLLDVARRWLHPWQRTVGILERGPGPAIVRLDIPPLTTPPARRARPDPVPDSALRPLDPIAVVHQRVVLSNGIVLRAARTRDTTHSMMVIHTPADSLPLLRVMMNDPVFTQAGPITSGSGPAFVVAVAGPRSPAELIATFRSAFESLPRPTPPVPEPIVGGEVRSRDPNNAQVDIAGRLPGVPRGHPDQRALELLNYIVGVPSYGGRLGWALTKAGLSYAVAAKTTFGAQDGQIAITTTCNPSNTDATIQAIREVIAGVGDRGVEEWELREAQAFTLGRMLLYGAREDATSATLSFALLQSELSGLDQLDLPAFSRAHLDVTIEELNRVASRYYRQERLDVRATGSVPPRGKQIFPDGTFRSLFDGHPQPAVPRP